MYYHIRVFFLMHFIGQGKDLQFRGEGLAHDSMFKTGCYPSESDTARSYCVLSDLFTGL